MVQEVFAEKWARLVKKVLVSGTKGGGGVQEVGGVDGC